MIERTRIREARRRRETAPAARALELPPGVGPNATELAVTTDPSAVHDFSSMSISLPSHRVRAPLVIQRDAVVTATAPSFQLTTPSLTTAPKPRTGLLGGEGPQLQLDPEIEAAMLAINQSLDATAIRTALANLQLGPGALPATPSMQSPGALPPTTPTPTAKPLVPAGAGPKTPRAASSGDIMSAVLKLPVVESAITNLREQAVGKVRSDWRQLNSGERAATVSTIAVIGIGSLAGAISDPDSRRFLLDQLNGKVLQVPGADFLHVEVGTDPDNLRLGLHVDVGRLLPSRLGFGPSTPTALGGPPKSIQREAGNLRVGSSIVQAAADKSRPRGGPVQNPISIADRIVADGRNGQPLPRDVRRSLSSELGSDLSEVRVHTGAAADQLARSLEANAFTTGHDIFFRSGRFDPRSSAGARLLAHEAIHTVQQSAGPVHGRQAMDGISISEPSDPDEQEATRTAEQIVDAANRPASPSRGNRSR